jgi:hypothetical protein
MATAMYFSCGDSTADLKTGTPTLTISASTTGTFSTAQTANIGVGDIVTYNTTDKAVIVGKTSTSVWTLRALTGGNPPAASGVSVDSIKHAFASLDALYGGWYGASFFNSADLVSADVQMNLTCYRDSADDTTAVSETATTITTDSTRYVHCYTPTDTTTECNNSQRHAGLWGTTGYRLAATQGAFSVTTIREHRITGLQLGTSSSSNNLIVCKIWRNVASCDGRIDQCIIRMNGTGAGTGMRGIYIDGASTGSVALISNCIVYASAGNSTGWVGIENPDASFTSTIHNCTVSGVTEGIKQVLGTMTVRNCLVDGGTTCISGTITQSYNATSDTTADGTGSRDSQTFTFVGAADFHITSGDAGARTYGTDLSGDATLPVTKDIDNATRGSTVDIGADQITVGLVADTIAANSTTSQNTIVGANVATPPSVLVTDDAVGVPSHTVTFTVTAGGGSMSPADGVVVTNASGIATLTSWTVGGSLGTNNNTIEATSAATLAGEPVTFNASGIAGGSGGGSLFGGGLIH